MPRWRGITWAILIWIAVIFIAIAAASNPAQPTSVDAVAFVFGPIWFLVLIVLVVFWFVARGRRG